MRQQLAARHISMKPQALAFVVPFSLTLISDAAILNCLNIISSALPFCLELSPFFLQALLNSSFSLVSLCCFSWFCGLSHADLCEQYFCVCGYTSPPLSKSGDRGAPLCLRMRVWIKRSSASDHISATQTPVYIYVYVCCQVG